MLKRQRRVHIVGLSPRTGTTLLHELMIHAFEIDGFAEHELEIFDRPRGDYDTVVSKAPRDLENVGPLLRFWRNLWVLCMIRDPRDVIVSTHGRRPDRYWVGLNIFRAREPIFRRLSGHSRFVVIRYEDLVKDPNGVQETLEQRLGFLVRRHPFSEYHHHATPSKASLKALGGLRPISASSVGVWRDHKPRVAYQIRRHGPLTQSLIEWGYEADGAWVDELLGIEEDESDSHLREERPPFVRRLKRGLRRRVGLVRCLLGVERQCSIG